MAATAPGAVPHDLQCLTISELETIAAQKMDKQTRDYYNEGADSGSTLRENISAFQKYRIRPRVLRDISQLDPSVEIWGYKSSLPLGVAPTAMQCLAHADGEIATSKACSNAGVVMGLSSFATTTLEDVAEAAGKNGSPRVLQLYLFEEREHSRKLIRRAKEAGYKAVFLTVDTPMLGRRNMEIRNQFKLPPHLKIANFTEDTRSDAAQTVMTGSAAGQDDVRSASTDKPEANTSAKRDEQKQQVAQASAPGYTSGGKRSIPTGKITFRQSPSNSPHDPFSSHPCAILEVNSLLTINRHTRRKSHTFLGTRHFLVERRMRFRDGSLGQRRRDSRRRPPRRAPRLRRHRRLQPRRPPAQRRPRHPRCPPRSRRSRARPDPRPRRRRRQTWHGRVQGAGAGRRFCVDWTARVVGFGV